MTQWQITLDGRTVSFSSDLALRLSQCDQQTGSVVQGRQGALQPQSISRLARTALTQAGIDARLCDLRHDYILTQLRHRSWAEMARELNMAEGDLRKTYSKLVTVPPPQQPAILPTEANLTALLQAPSLGALAVALAFYHGLTSQQLRALTWQDLPPLPQLDIQPLLPANPEQRIFPSCSSALSQLAGQTLCQHGLLGVTLQNLAGQHHRREPLATILSYLDRHQSITCGQGQLLLNRNKNDTYRLLQGCVKDGALVQVGGAYYSAQQVPPLQDHAPLVLSLVHRRGAVYAEDVEQLLHLHTKSCQRLLQAMVTDGQLVRFGTRYQLSPQG